MITINEKIPSVSVKMSEVSEPRDSIPLTRKHKTSVYIGLPDQKGEEDNKTYQAKQLYQEFA